MEIVLELDIMELMIERLRRADHSRWPCTTAARNDSKRIGCKRLARARTACRGSPCCPESPRSPPPAQLQSREQGKINKNKEELNKL